jgi:hypothetical protein
MYQANQQNHSMFEQTVISYHVCAPYIRPVNSIQLSHAEPKEQRRQQPNNVKETRDITFGFTAEKNVGN